MSNPARYRIGAVARLTGLSTHTIRMWERRYAVVVPQRSSGGGRLYSDGDVTRLRLLRQSVERGRAIGQVAELSNEQLREYLDEAAPASAPELENAEDVIRTFLDYVDSFDMDRAETVLSHATTALAPERFVVDVVSPILVETGKRWENGTFSVAHEHAASGVVRGVLSNMLRAQKPRPNAPVAVAATPSGENHELGLLMASLMVSLAGWRVIYLGASVPSDDILRTLSVSGASLIVLSLIRETDDRVHEIRRIALERPKTVRVLVGGTAGAGVSAAGIETIQDLEELSQLLDSIKDEA